MPEQHEKSREAIRSALLSEAKQLLPEIARVTFRAEGTTLIVFQDGTKVGTLNFSDEPLKKMLLNGYSLPLAELLYNGLEAMGPRIIAEGNFLQQLDGKPITQGFDVRRRTDLVIPSLLINTLYNLRDKNAFQIIPELEKFFAFEERVLDAGESLREEDLQGDINAGFDQEFQILADDRCMRFIKGETTSSDKQQLSDPLFWMSKQTQVKRHSLELMYSLMRERIMYHASKALRLVLEQSGEIFFGEALGVAEQINSDAFGDG